MQLKNYINWIIKGLAMGAADVVPGVSGGTLAFILGIYERFLGALASFNGEALRFVAKGQWRAFWRHVDGTFLLCLFGGILSSIFSLATLIHYLLINNPLPLWAFFNGLIIAALPWLLKAVRFNAARIALLVAGALFAFSISLLTPVHSDPMPLMFFGAGFIAICAMILPGISGSFLLLLMGMYAPVVSAVSDARFNLLALFALGCVVGLLAFSRLLNMLLKRHHDTMLAFLCGVVIGALYRIWPWQIEGDIMLPVTYAEATGSTQWLVAAVCLLAGAATILLLLRLEHILGKRD
ncbi:DUF368 domain-containing protein [Aliidiomarina sedimenti]|uniref:DUF368 domain-containing protein n=1 Tax=Aliidiomarina sedimenti TaxID=1933879 RepID=A0ABY0BXZ5_9GAMM|nr:DUF368 domain-containing protein [Aliidiomarina sedimenti]RUO29365.1 DUF368 domain-containing protein [Aliidiomarina sedimenti]